MAHLSTLTKIRIAKAAYSFIHPMLSLSGISKNNSVSAKRNGIRWNLDLKEGIDLSIYLFGKFESGTSHLLRKRIEAGMTVIDVGANIGAHALPMANWVRPGGCVYAIEPTKWAFDKLSKNLEQNPNLQTSLQVFQMGFTDEDSSQPEAFSASWDVTDFESGDKDHGGQLKTTEGARFLSLDQFVKEQEIKKVDLIKIDVDGFEPKVLRSASVTLERDRPDILIEVCPYILKRHDQSVADLLAPLQSLDYKFFDESTLSPLPTEEEELCKLIPERGSINILAST